MDQLNSWGHHRKKNEFED